MNQQRPTTVASLLARVREAVRAQPSSSHEPDSAQIARRVPMDSTDLAELFTARAQSVGMRVTRIRDDQLHDTLLTLTASRGKTVIAIRDRALAARVTSAVPDAVTNNNADILFDCAIGITDVDCAISESGSLVISTTDRIRNAWITPPTHIAIVRESQLLPDLVDLFTQRPDVIDAASTTIITGPSKTADIEGVLVTGVHGPALVEIVLVG